MVKIDDSQLPKPSIKGFIAIFLKTLRQNKYFFYCFLLFLLMGGLSLTLNNQGDLLLFFSEHRTPFGDFFFKNVTKIGEEWAYIGFILLYLFTRFRVSLLILLTGLVVTIISFLSKSYFLHPRPSEYYKQLGTLNDLNLVEGVHLVKGFTSFPSGHTMAAFALLCLVALFAKNKKLLGVFLFLCAIMVGLSRIYLVLHFFKDIYLGAIMGVMIALIIYIIQALKLNGDS